MKWRNPTSTPGQPKTNGVAERAVRRVKEGTASLLVQSGLAPSWWVSAMICYCFLRNIVDKTNTGSTAYYNRFKKSCEAPLIPFGAEVTYVPITTQDKDRLHQMGEKVLHGIFIGYPQRSGGS